jgi:YbbR domain-containing protein
VLQRIIEWTTTDWALKLTALALAFLLWTTVRADTPGQWETDVPVRVVNNDADWVLAEPPVPAQVRVVLRGPYRELLRAASERPEVVIPIDEVSDSLEDRQLYDHLVRMPSGTPGTRVTGVQPGTVRLTWDRVATRLIPLTVQLVGEPAPGFRLAGPPEIEPSVVRASGAGRNLARIDSLALPQIDLRDRRSADTLQLVIDTTGTGIIISPRTVRVFIPVLPIIPGGDAMPPISAGARRPGG